jgi:pyruvate/2-oxoglutarate dehydrogenase complex dihydrolipoamide dehydrogenase (E3) component
MQRKKITLDARLDAVIKEIKKGNSPSTLHDQLDSTIGDLKSYSALELARLARMAANRAYLLEVAGADEVNHGCIQSKMLTQAAKKLAAHVAEQTCSTVIAKSQLVYQKINLALTQEEKALKQDLEKIRGAKELAKNNLQAAKEAVQIIEKELNLSNQPKGKTNARKKRRR